MRCRSNLVLRNCWIRANQSQVRRSGQLAVQEEPGDLEWRPGSFDAPDRPIEKAHVGMMSLPVDHSPSLRRLHVSLHILILSDQTCEWGKERIRQYLTEDEASEYFSDNWRLRIIKFVMATYYLLLMLPSL